jgi:hypothetical protein
MPPLRGWCLLGFDASSSVRFFSSGFRDSKSADSLKLSLETLHPAANVFSFSQTVSVLAPVGLRVFGLLAKWPSARLLLHFRAVVC